MRPLKEVIQAIRAKKSLGQNFLTDPNILNRIVESSAPLEGRTVIEIGPGPGGLSREIIKHSCRELILIEMDLRAIPFLEELKDYSECKLTVLKSDALKIPIHQLGEPPRKIIANLPYNISVPLLLQCLQHIDDFESLTLMFQKEVAQRLWAKPNTKDYGRLSVMCQWSSTIKKLFDLPPGAFIPAPKVTSTVVHLMPRTGREELPWNALEKVTKAAFSQRRKMLRSSLKELLPNPQDILKSAHIDPERRAESLSVEEFCELAKEWIKYESQK